MDGICRDHNRYETSTKADGTRGPAGFSKIVPAKSPLTSVRLDHFFFEPVVDKLLWWKFFRFRDLREFRHQFSIDRDKILAPLKRNVEIHLGQLIRIIAHIVSLKETGDLSHAFKRGHFIRVTS